MHAMSFTAKKAAERLALRRAVTVLTKCSLKVVSCVSLTVMISFSFIISLWSYSQNHLSLKLNFFLLKKCNVFVNCGVLWVNIITSHAILLQQSVKQCLKSLLRHVQTAEIQLDCSDFSVKLDQMSSDLINWLIWWHFVCSEVCKILSASDWEPLLVFDLEKVLYLSCSDLIYQKLLIIHTDTCVDSVESFCIDFLFFKVKIM